MESWELAGLPLHPLVVHGAVVLTPLAVVIALCAVLWPSSRWLTRWLAVGTAVFATVVAWLATQSGEALLEARPFLESSDSPVRDLVRAHEERGEQLLWILVAFTVAVALAAWTLPARSPLASGRGTHRGVPQRWLQLLAVLAVVTLGVLAVVWVVLTGDAGARAVWEV